MKFDPDKMRLRREELTYDKSEVAKLAKMSAQQYHNLEAGMRPDPRVSTVARIAKVLRCKIEELMT
jgi:DNA-binding XRE family transcriptional regulator